MGLGDFFENFGEGVGQIGSSLYPDRPKSLADTTAGQAATTYADKLVQNQADLKPPTYGTAPSVPVAKPMPPSQDDYDIVSGKFRSTGTYGAPATASTMPASDATNRLGGMPAGGGNAAANALAAENAPQSPTMMAPDQAAAKAAAQARIDKYNADLAEWNAIYGGQAATSNAQVNATTIAAPQLASAQMNTAPTMAGATAAPAPQIDMSQIGKVAANNVAAPGAITAGTVTAQQIGPQTQAQVGDIPTDSFGRDAQIAALRNYAAVAAGTAPSAAEALLRKGIDENVGAQLGMAATLQGNTPGLALRSGLSGAANAIAKSSADMAALRAQEQETGRAGFLTAATGIRTSDITIAQSNQTKDLTTAANNLTAQIEVLKSNQQAALSAGQSNVANDLQAKIQTATNQLEAAKANAANSLTADVANLTARLDASKANQAQQVATNIANLNAQIQTMQANLQAAVDTNDHNQATQLQQNIEQMRAQLDAQKASQQALLDAAKANMQNAQYNATNQQNESQFHEKEAALEAGSNADRAQNQQIINNNLYSNETSAATQALATSLGISSSDLQRYLDWQKGNAATTGSLVSSGGGILGKLLAA